MKVFCTIMSIFASSAFAATGAFDLKLDVSSNGKHISSPHIKVKQGETGTITQDNNSKQTFIDVVATEGTNKGVNGISMDFKAGTIGANGEKTITSTPHIFTKENERAEVTVDEDGSTDSLSFSVVATKTTL